MDDPSRPPGVLRICPSCNNPVETGHKFCETCGARMPELPICRKCGAQFIAPVKFCEMCGTPVTADENFSQRDEIAKIQAPEPGPEFEEPEPEPEPAYEVSEPEEPESAYEEAEPEPEVPKHARNAGEQKPKTPVPARTPPPSKPIGDPGPDPLSAAFSGLSDDPVKPVSAKPSMNKALVGGVVIVLLIGIAGVYFIGLPMLNGGDMPFGTARPPEPVSTPLPEPVTPAATMPPVTKAPEVTATANSLQPEPTQLIPKSQEVFFDVQKDAVRHEILVLFQRGPGENSINYAEITVTYPDGTVKTGTIRPSKGQSELMIQGSRQTDRVEVIAHMYTGQSYRVKDLLVL